MCNVCVCVHNFEFIQKKKNNNLTNVENWLSSIEFNQKCLFTRQNYDYFIKYRSNLHTFCLLSFLT